MKEDSSRRTSAWLRCASRDCVTTVEEARRMFVYRCPGCGKWHLTAKEPEQGNAGQCSGCGRPIEVPETARQPAPVHAATAPSPDPVPEKKSARPQSARDEEAVTARRPPRPRRPAPAK